MFYPEFFFISNQNIDIIVSESDCLFVYWYVFPQAIGGEIRSRLQQFVEERMQTTMVQKLTNSFSELKGKFTQKFKFSHPHVIPNPYDLHSSSEHK